jgi:hypothetical protein
MLYDLYRDFVVIKQVEVKIVKFRGENQGALRFCCNNLTIPKVNSMQL